MKEYSIFFILLSSIYLLSCNDEDLDTSPPIVEITYPKENDVISEIAQIRCVATDNDSIDFLELWVDSIATGIIDTSNPYEFSWNTVPFVDSTELTLFVVARDVYGNIGRSNEVSLLIDNSKSHPKAVDVISITYTELEMTITFNRSRDLDFSKYKLFRSPANELFNSFIIEINTIDDTSVSITDFNPLEEFWYWIEVEDIHGYTSIGRSCSVQDYPPISPILNDIQFLDSMFYVHWSANNENDFQSYEVYESSSEDMSSPSKIFETNDIFINSLNHFQISQNQYTYYQIITTDHWGLKSSSNTKEGCSWSLFSENYGGISYDYGRSMIETNDGSYIVAGNTSFLGDQFNNVLMVAVDKKGQQKWMKNYSFSTDDRINSIVPASAEGFIMAGYTANNSNLSKDILVFKTDLDGNINWQHSYGDQGNEFATSIAISDDGSSIFIAGSIIEENNGTIKCYVLRIDSMGNLVWDKVIESGISCKVNSIENIGNVGFILTGMRRSPNEINEDLVVMKIDTNGELIWERTYGGNGVEAGSSIKSIDDGGFIISGYTDSFGSGNKDVYVIKVNSEGDQEWYQTFGGSGTDYGNSIHQTLDQGYLVSGYTDSFGQYGGYDLWLIKLNQNGELDWQKFYGGSNNDIGLFGFQTMDSGFIIGGYSNSNENNIPDILLVKTDNVGKTN